VTDERKIRENRQALYVEQCRKAYVEWIEATAMLDEYHRIKNRRGYAINYYAIRKSLEERESHDQT